MPKHAGPGIAGKNKRKCERYRQQGRRLKNKLKRIARSNGARAVAAYETAVLLGTPIRFPKKAWKG